jgi:hypothetical protein
VEEPQCHTSSARVDELAQRTLRCVENSAKAKRRSEQLRRRADDAHRSAVRLHRDAARLRERAAMLRVERAAHTRIVQTSSNGLPHTIVPVAWGLDAGQARIGANGQST